MARQLVLTARVLTIPVGRKTWTREAAVGTIQAQVSGIEKFRQSDRSRLIEQLCDEQRWLLEVNQVYPPFPGL